MCGIVGYIGKRKAYPILIKGLHRLEYRGYDSAGVALINEQGQLNIYKAKGKVSELEAFAADKDTGGTIGIAHTRWATHGEPNTVNAHPHYSESERLAIIHNGIIENYAVLKAGLMEQGYTFRSETDTEVLVQLIEYTQLNEHVDLKTAVQLALQQVIGAYAIAVLDKAHPDTLIAARKGSPLVVGVGKEEYFLASDATPIVEYTDKVIYIDDEEVVSLVIGKEVDITTINNVQKTPEIKRLELSLSQLEKGGYPHFMLKEIFEQPRTLTDSMRGRVNVRQDNIGEGLERHQVKAVLPDQVDAVIRQRKNQGVAIAGEGAGVELLQQHGLTRVVEDVHVDRVHNRGGTAPQGEQVVIPEFDPVVVKMDDHGSAVVGGVTVTKPASSRASPPRAAGTTR